MGYAEWEQLADSRIMSTCDDCVMGPKDGGCAFCGYGSFDGFPTTLAPIDWEPDRLGT